MASLTLIVRRRTFMALACLIPLIGVPAAHAATPAEAFVADNIQKGLGTLNDPKLSAGERSEQFERLLLSITDMNRVATFTLGQYAQAASRKTPSPVAGVASQSPQFWCWLSFKML